MEKNKKIKLPQISQEKTTMSGPTFGNTNLGDKENGTKKENDKRIQGEQKSEYKRVNSNTKVSKVKRIFSPCFNAAAWYQ